MEHKGIAGPDRRQEFLDGSERLLIAVGPVEIGHGTYRPGWRWSEHVQPLAGRESDAHTGYVLSGRLTVRAADGSEVTVGPGEAFHVGPGHDAWVVSAEPCVALDFAPK